LIYEAKEQFNQTSEVQRANGKIPILSGSLLSNLRKKRAVQIKERLKKYQTIKICRDGSKYCEPAFSEIKI